MKKQLLIFSLLFSFLSYSQLITFDDQGHVDGNEYGNPYMITNNGETFIFTISGVTGGPTSHRYRTTDIFGCGNTGFNHLSSGTFSATTWTIETQSGNEIDLGTIRFDNFFLCFAFSYELTIEGFKNNLSTGSQTFTVSGMNSIFTPNSNFDDVDRIVVSCADLGNLGIDNINWVISPLSSDSFSLNKGLKVFPNPVSEKFSISGLSEATEYSIFNLLGVEIKKGKISETDEIQTNDLISGVYLLKLNNKKIIKFIKNN